MTDLFEEDPRVVIEGEGKRCNATGYLSLCHCELHNTRLLDTKLAE